MTHPIPFRYTFGIAKAEQRADGYYIVGEASGPEVDVTQERMAPEAISKFAAQIALMASAGTPLTYRDAHAQDGVLRDLGVITQGWVDERLHLGIEVKLDSESPSAMYLFRQLLKGKQYGMSIAGHVIDYVDELVEGQVIRTYREVALTEISNTTRPAWTPSFGTVLSKAIDEAAAESVAAAQGENVDPKKGTLDAGSSTEAAPAEDIDLSDPVVIEVDLSDVDPATEDEDDETEKAVWTTAYINSLPDSSFAVIEAGGKKVDGKTTPRSLRHFPYKDENGKVDAAHVRNALARLPQSNLSPALKAKAKAVLVAAAKQVGIEVGGKSDEPEEQLEQTEGPEAPATEKTEGDSDETPDAGEEAGKALEDLPIVDETGDDETTETPDVSGDEATAAKSADEEPADEAGSTETTEKAIEDEADVEKAGRAISAANAKRMLAVYEEMASMLRELGLLPQEDAPAKSDSEESETDLTKTLSAENADLKALVVDLQKSLEEKTGRITELENTPGSPQPPLIERAEVEDAMEKVRKMTPSERLRLGLSLNRK